MCVLAGLFGISEALRSKRHHPWCHAVTMRGLEPATITKFLCAWQIGMVTGTSTSCAARRRTAPRSPCRSSSRMVLSNRLSCFVAQWRHGTTWTLKSLTGMVMGRWTCFFVPKKLAQSPRQLNVFSWNFWNNSPCSDKILPSSGFIWFYGSTEQTVHGKVSMQDVRFRTPNKVTVSWLEHSVKPCLDADVKHFLFVNGSECKMHTLQATGPKWFVEDACSSPHTYSYYPRPSMYGIVTYIGVINRVYVCNYSRHG